ncbi:protein rep [Acinetobacter sp. B10A]|uniref:protein rep n=1 Tax=Acinetobacter baretiae TaxID=2605383 RepID=UPI001B3C8EFB|nr:protein rep [Acinetobacter baretiae]MBF7686621.1 protein rep [Acinetobacter baretiae]
MSQSCHDFDDEINFLSEISPNDLSWDQHRSNAEDVAVLYNRNIEFTKYADRINGCSGYLKFAVSDGKLVLKEVWFCRVRHCPVCQWRRSLKMRAMMYKNIDRVIQEYPAHRWVFLTLTVKNPHVKDLKSTLNLMNKGWKRLIESNRFENVVDGSIRTTEITRPKKKNEQMEVHPHFHAMLLVKSTYFNRDYIKQADWIEMWSKAMRLTYTPQVHVKAVKPNKKKTHEQNTGTLHSAILETFKYSVKPSDMLAYDDQGEWLCEVTKQTHRMRFLSTGGVLKDILSEDITNQEMIAPDSDKEQLEADEDKPRFRFTYVPQYRRYVFNPNLND